MEKMEKQVQAKDDKPTEGGKAKKPYETPTLTKLGTVRELTEGTPVTLVPDVALSSK